MLSILFLHLNTLPNDPDPICLSNEKLSNLDIILILVSSNLGIIAPALKSPNPSNDLLGNSVSVSGKNFVAGANQFDAPGKSNTGKVIHSHSSN